MQNANTALQTRPVTPVVDAEVVPDTTLQPLSPVVPPPALTPEQLAEDAAEGAARRAGNSHDRLTHFETLALLDLYHREKLTQVQIAKRLNVNQSTVSRTLAKYADTTALAKQRLRARSEEIVEKIIDNGEAKDLIKLLKGIKTDDGTRVLEADREFASGKPAKDGRPNVYVGVKVDVK